MSYFYVDIKMRTPFSITILIVKNAGASEKYNKKKCIFEQVKSILWTRCATKTHVAGYFILLFLEIVNSSWLFLYSVGNCKAIFIRVKPGLLITIHWMKNDWTLQKWHNKDSPFFKKFIFIRLFLSGSKNLRSPKKWSQKSQAESLYLVYYRYNKSFLRI